jgi:hypothetical protein
MNVWKEQDLVFENRHYLMHIGLLVTNFSEIQKNMISNFKLLRVFSISFSFTFSLSIF